MPRCTTSSSIPKTRAPPLDMLAQARRVTLFTRRVRMPRPPARALALLDSAPPPAVRGVRVYAYGITGVLVCVEAASGKIVWQLDARKEFEALFPTFGFSSSPLIDGKNVIVAVGAKGASVAAFNRDTGKVA